MRVRWKLVLSITVGLWMWFYFPNLTTASSPSALTLSINPRFGFEPLTVMATLTIEPNQLNRELCIEAASDEYGRSSCLALE